MLMLLMRELLGCGFGCAGLFFLGSLWISILSKVILIFMGLPPTPSWHWYYIPYLVYSQALFSEISVIFSKNTPGSPWGKSGAVLSVPLNDGVISRLLEVSRLCFRIENRAAFLPFDPQPEQDSGRFAHSPALEIVLIFENESTSAPFLSFCAHILFLSSCCRRSFLCRFLRSAASCLARMYSRSIST